MSDNIIQLSDHQPENWATAEEESAVFDGPANDGVEMTEEELTELKLKKYTLTPEQIAEYGEEIAKKKQEALDYLFQLRQDVTAARKERAERLANATDKERYQMLKEEKDFAKRQALWGKNLLKQQRKELEDAITQQLSAKIQELYGQGKLLKAAEEPTERVGKKRKHKKA